MRKLALVVASLAVLISVAAVAQQRCHNNSALCIGSANTDLYIQGNVYAASPDGGSITISAGAMTNPLTVTNSGTSTSSGTIAPAVIDAGTVYVRGDVQVAGKFSGAVNLGSSATAAAVIDAGTALFRGDVQFAGAIIPTSTTVNGDITLNGASPAVATATVRSGAKCVCTLVGTSAATAAKGVACSVSSTTLTATSANAANEHVQYICY